MSLLQEMILSWVMSKDFSFFDRCEGQERSIKQDIWGQFDVCTEILDKNSVSLLE